MGFPLSVPKAFTSSRMPALIFSVYEVSPFGVYHPDAIQMGPGWWNNVWYDFGGIER